MTENCRYLFQWATNLACPPTPVAPQTNCVVNDPVTGALYDLTPLIKDNSNWIAVDDSEAFFFSYSFNLCRPLVQTPLTQGACAAGNVAGCQAVRNPSTAFVSLGVVSSPYLYNGNVAISLPNVRFEFFFFFSRLIVGQGSPCAAGNFTNTTILFECNLEAGLVCLATFIHTTTV
jgi:hypothetical protein